MSRFPTLFWICIFCNIQDILGDTVVKIEPSSVLAGETVTISCEAGASDRVLWYKRQASNPPVTLGSSSSDGNQVTNTLFQSRLTASEGTADQTGNKKYIMTIQDPDYKDFGEYGCEPLSVTQAQIKWNSLSVIKPIEKVDLYMQKSASGGLNNAIKLEDGDDLIVNNTDRYFVICVTSASNPPSELTITFAGKDITSDFSVLPPAIREVPTPNTNGLGEVTYAKQAIGNKLFEVPKASNRKLLTCSGHIPKLENKSSSVRVIKEGEPVLICDKNPKAWNGETDVKVTCMVEAEPEPSVEMTFTSGGENVKLIAGSSHGVFSLIQRNNDTGLWEVSLTISKVNEDAYTTYQISADNKYGTTNTTFALEEVDAGHDHATATKYSITMMSAIVTLTILPHLI